MITRPSECQGCFSKEVCSLSALSIEDSSRRDPKAGQFDVFKDMEANVKPEVRAYFKKWFECINLEQTAEQERISSSYNSSNSKEEGLRLISRNSNGMGGFIATLQKPINPTKTSELGERAFVNMYTENNISFAKGFIISKNFTQKPTYDEKINPNQYVVVSVALNSGSKKKQKFI